MITDKDGTPIKLATSSVYAGGAVPGGWDTSGAFYMPNSTSAFGVSPEKLIVPKEYHTVLQMVYDFYQRGGLASTVISRLAEFTITPIRNGQRDSSNEVNAYFEAVKNNLPSRLMRFLRSMALEYWLSGMVLPRVDWVKKYGRDLSPDLKPNKVYIVPQFDLYPALLTDVQWAGWGQKKYFLKIPEKDVRLIRSGGSKIKAQQNKYLAWQQNYPHFINVILNGNDSIELEDVDPILRKEISASPYPTPFLFPVLEPLIYRQQLRRMDFAVASRVINAILLVQEGDKDFPLVASGDASNPENTNLNALEQQINARSGNPLLMERLFILFTNHTTKLTWISPDVEAMLNQDKYRQVNDELQEGLGFTQILITGESRQAQASEVSTWAIQPQMEEFRDMVLEWLTNIYKEAGEKNSFNNKKLPIPKFKPIRLQDYIKTAAVIAQAFKEGNVSRTTRTELLGLDLQTEAELMKDEQEILKGLPSFTPTPYSPPPPMIGDKGGRPIGSQNVPVNNRNQGVKPPGQEPLSRVKAEIELLDDEELIELINKVALEREITITPEMIID
jgi:hypothetical protein